MSKTKLVFIGIIAVIFLYVFISYFFGSDENKIRDIIFDAQQAIMQENLSETFNDVALEYEDDSGIKYLPARYIMKNFFETTDQINLRIPNITITVRGKEATAGVELILTGYSGGRNQYILGTPDNPTVVDIGLRKGIMGWKVISTRNIRPSRAYLGREEESE